MHYFIDCKGEPNYINDKSGSLKRCNFNLKNRRNHMQKIIPFLWFDNRAEEAVEFYISLFADSKILNITRYQKQGAEVSGQPAGSVMSVEFELAGQKFTALNGGPVFKFTPAISFFANCGSREEVDRLWAALGRDGSILMLFFNMKKTVRPARGRLFSPSKQLQLGMLLCLLHN
jgi:predicted 3-demethylubiquinone-9 3-methyltransferase (glyoxalase superfamily)